MRSNTTIAKQNSTVLVSAGRTSAPLYDFMTNDQVVLPGRSTVDVRTMAHIIKAVILFCHVLNCQISPVDLSGLVLEIRKLHLLVWATNSS